jgi:hypothetical protein
MRSLNVEAPAAYVAAGAAIATILLLGSLHVLSPEFAPSWRMVSEYAFGHYAWVLSMMFVLWGVSSWALAVAIWRDVGTKAGKLGLWFLIVAGIGEAMASIFDVTHETGGLGHAEAWHGIKKTLLCIANLSWISVVLLAAPLGLMTMQLIQASGGHLPQHAPKSLPQGVLALDGWANRLIVVSFCLCVFVAAWHAIKLRRKHA